MKKLLSVFAIIGGILGSTLPTITACKTKPKPKANYPLSHIMPIQFNPGKFNLNDIQLYNLGIESDMSMNRNALLHNISLQIMNEYNSESFANKLKGKNFMYGANLDNKHSWAIEVMNINGKTPLVFDKNNEAYLRFPPNYTVLKDNALKVKITTSIKNANTKTAIVNGYLSSFIYTNANLNQGHNLLISDASGFVIEGNHPTVFDISNDFRQFPHQDHVEWVYEAMANISSDSDAKISKIVFTALNKQLETETKTLNDLNVLNIIDVTKQKINFRDHQYQYPRGLKIYRQTTASATLQEITRQQELSTAPGTKLFAQLSFDINGINRIPEYVAAPNTYLYFYLGSTI